MIAGGTALSSFSVGLTSGTYAAMIDMATRSSVGHLQVQRESYLNSPDLFSTITDAETAKAQLLQTQGVTAVTARVESGGLFALGKRTTGGMAIGVNPATEGAVTTVPAQVTKGRWLGQTRQPDANAEVVVGDGLATALHAKIGDELSFIGQGADGSIAAELFTVVGVTSVGGVGMPLGYMHIEDARELLVLGGRSHRLLAAVADLDEVDDIAASVVVEAPDRVMPWSIVLPNLARSIEADRSGSWVFLGIILLVVLFGVSNTMMMAVFERTREFGVLLALGTRPSRIIVTTVLEGLLLATAAAAAGGAIGAAVNAFIGAAGIPLGDYAVEFGGVNLTHMPARNTALSIVVVPSIVAICGALAGLQPALRAGRLQPNDALRD